MKYAQISAMLSGAGKRLTSPRKQVGQWIASRGGLFSASEILRDLPHLDKVSVYRTLDVFESLDIIHQASSMHSEIHYEAHAQKNHHHHIACVNCEHTKCVPCTVTQTGIRFFKNIHHTVAFTGICRVCARA